MPKTNADLLDYMKELPAPYAPSSDPFWDDAHISQGMLAAHLAPEVDAASRPHRFIGESVAWIAAYCGGGEGKTLLDLGCGPGLYARELTEKGFAVTGIDFSRRSIEYARAEAEARGQKIAYHYQDYLTMDYEAAFDAVILVYCDFGVLAPGDRRTLLRKIHRALKPGGVLLLDAWNEPHLESYQEKETVSYENGGFWSAAPYVVIERDVYYRQTRNTLDRYILVTADDCRCFNIWNQIYTPDTLTAEMREAGFTDFTCFDDVAGAAFTGARETICVAARK